MFRIVPPALPDRRLTTQASVRGAFALVALRGELDAGTAVGALYQLRAVLDAGAAEVLVDLSGITAINEAGIATLHEAAETVSDRDGRIFLFHASDKLAGRFEVTG